MGQSSTAVAGATAASDGDVATVPVAPAQPPSNRRWYRLALAATVLLVVSVVVALPIALRSMVDELLDRQDNLVYDVLTGNVVSPHAAGAAPADVTFVNVAVTDINEATGLATLGVSGHRACAADCPTVEIVLLSMNDDAAYRRGLSPSATVTLTPQQQIFTQTVQLPVSGSPSYYPFDTYRLWLGLAALVTPPGGAPTPVTPATLAGRAAVTLQNQSPDFIMARPVAIDPARVEAPTDLVAPLAVQGLTFQHPGYLKVLTVLLIVLITVSGTMALFTREVSDLLLGVGGLILGIWGIRSVIVPQPLPTVSAIDLALSCVILFLLLGLAIRSARHFHRHSDLPLPRPSQHVAIRRYHRHSERT